MVTRDSPLLLAEEGLLEPGQLSALEDIGASSAALLEATARCMDQIIGAAQPSAALGPALRLIGEVLRIDRAAIAELPGAHRDSTTVHYRWDARLAALQVLSDADAVSGEVLPSDVSASDASSAADPSAATMTAHWLEAVDESGQPLVQGWPLLRPDAVPLLATRLEAAEPLRSLLATIDAAALLMVPVRVEDRQWVVIFEDDRDERGWQAPQQRLLTLLARVLAAALAREQLHEQIRDRDALLQAINQCAAALVSAAEVQGAIVDSLGVIANALGVDRVLLNERVPGEEPAEHYRVRAVWRSSEAPPCTAEAAVRPDGECAARPASQPVHEDAEVRAWMAPLTLGTPVQMRLSRAQGAVRVWMECQQLRAALALPVMSNGLPWGYIRLDCCARERSFRPAQLDALRTLCELIGAAIAREGHLHAIATADTRIALLARSDALTGLANRMTFNDRLRQAFAAAQRAAHPFAVLYLDLDRFKEINDTLGHSTGDRLLQQVARRLQGATRATDVVARLGGDEFAIVQGEIVDSASAGTLAEKVIEVLSAPYEMDGAELHIGVSIGIALYTPDSLSPDALLVQADQALYRAKHAGRGRYRFHSDQIDQETRVQLVLADGLRGAMQRGELEIRYQPQVELASGRIVGMEALLRWNHPTRGVLLPEDFLPIAEKYGLMQQLGRWVLGEACRQMAVWRRQGMAVPVVAINVALAQIRMGREFVRDVMDSLYRWALKPADIELDVTELVLARATLAQSSVLEELRQLGVGIAIDDFGARYSSLDYLRNYRVNRLKIARGMIATADVEPGGGAMVRAILSLARELDVEVVAEGVETEAQCRLLVDANASAQGQGFYYSHAVCAEDTLSMLRSGVVVPGAENRQS